jgi:hypothetical protein
MSYAIQQAKAVGYELSVVLYRCILGITHQRGVFRRKEKKCMKTELDA